MSDKHIHPQLPIYEGAYTAVPTFFVDDLMRIGKGIPSSFWKLTFAVWRSIVAPTRKNGDAWVYEYSCDITVQQFHDKFKINKAAVADWTRAYSVSGLFTINKGQHNRPDQPATPTHWQYNQNAGVKDWHAFVVALSRVLCDEDHRMKRQGKHDSVNSAAVFALKLALAVDHCRSEINGAVGPTLPPVNTARIEKLIREGHGRRLADGTIEWNYVPTTPLRKLKPGEYAERLE